MNRTVRHMDNETIPSPRRAFAGVDAPGFRAEVKRLRGQGMNRDDIAAAVGVKEHRFRILLGEIDAELAADRARGIDPAEAADLSDEDLALLNAEDLDVPADQLPAWFEAQGITPAPSWERVTVPFPRTYTAYDAEGNELERTAIGYWKVKNPESEAGAGPFVVEQAEPVNVRINIAAKLPTRRPSNLKTAVVFGDAQIGYWQDPDTEEWNTCHDEAAIDILEQVIADVEAEVGIDALVNTGDHMDLPQFSRHRSSPSVTSRQGFRRTINRTYQFNARLAALTPNATRTWVRGNHDERINLWLIDNAEGLVGLRRAGTDPAEEEPVLSLDFLLRVRESGWDLTSPYPHGIHALSPRTIALHGTCSQPTHAKTSARYVNEYPTCDVFFGHTHRSGEVRVVKSGLFGQDPMEYVYYNPGALCRRDYAVPSATGAHTEKGTPVIGVKTERWDQGLGVVTYDPSDPTFTPVIEHVRIQHGQAFFRGRRYVARCDANGKPLA